MEKGYHFKISTLKDILGDYASDCSPTEHLMHSYIYIIHTNTQLANNSNMLPTFQLAALVEST